MADRETAVRTQLACMRFAGALDEQMRVLLDAGQDIDDLRRRSGRVLAELGDQFVSEAWRLHPDLQDATPEGLEAELARGPSR